MSEIVFNIVYTLTDCFLFFLLVLSFYVLKRDNKIKSYSIFHLYLLACFIDNLALEILKVFDLLERFNWLWFELIFSIIHFSLLALFILKQIKNLTSNFYWIYFLILLILVGVNFFDLMNGSYYSASISNVGLIIFCLIYFLDLLKDNSGIVLKNDPLFLIITGIFLGSGTLTPILLFGNHLKEIIDPDTFFWVALLSPISSIIMYSLFLKSFLCILRIKK